MSLLSVLIEPDIAGVRWGQADLAEANALLRDHHYLGPARSAHLVVGAWVGHQMVATQVWRWPTARHLPTGGRILELVRWCLTPAAGENAGSRMHRHAVRLIRRELPAAQMCVSYSDPSQGHTGALYRACNWRWAPTWHRLRPPPTGLGSWDGTTRQAVKDRWVFPLVKQPTPTIVAAFRINDPAAVRGYLTGDALPESRRWAPLIPWSTYGVSA